MLGKEFDPVRPPSICSQDIVFPLLENPVTLSIKSLFEKPILSSTLNPFDEKLVVYSLVVAPGRLIVPLIRAVTPLPTSLLVIVTTSLIDTSIAVASTCREREFTFIEVDSVVAPTLISLLAV